ncbi:cell wall-binding protein [Lysinibacillus contaminans]|uniref:Cell wall-binding protein n=1 Tax=Lysinibacillus contaminans TaxID=1293441 RepID=A0ABR5JXA3_9BACI|nr:cell wall-binding protein [Lysinibacillus contaminans]
MKSKLRVGIITSLLLAPAAIVNAQEQEATTQNITQSIYNHAIAAIESKDQLQLMYKNLTDKSSLDEITIAESRVGGLISEGFTADEITFVEAKLKYVRAQKTLLTKIKSLGTNINKLTYTSSSLVRDVEVEYNVYLDFMNEEIENSYAKVQKTFKDAVTVAPQTAITSMLGLAVQYGHDETARKAYFKTNGADIDKLETMKFAVATIGDAIKNLDNLMKEVENPTPDYANIKTIVAEVTTAYNTLSADNKKIVVAYIPKGKTVAPYKIYTEALTNITTAQKVEDSITQLKAKTPANFAKATNFISEVAAIETAYGKLNENVKKFVSNFIDLAPFKAAADVSKQITALQISSDDSYRTAVSNLMQGYTALLKKEFVKNAIDLTEAEENIKSAVAIEVLIKDIKGTAPADIMTKINAARGAYDSPSTTANVKKIINNLTELTDWEKKYSDSLNVDKLIAALNPTATTFESLTIAAQAAFDKLGATEKSLVKDFKKLELYFIYADLSRKVNALKSTQADYQAQTKALQIEVGKLNSSTAEVDAVVALDAIKTKLSEKLADLSKVETDLETVLTKIEALKNSQNLVQDMLDARKLYEALDAPTKKRVTNLKVLTDLEKSHKAVISVVSLVEKLDPASKDYIKKAKSANTAYLKLDEAKRTYVKNYSTLISDRVAAMGVITQIDALKTTQKTYKANVQAAKDAYGALSPSALALVTNHGALLTAEGYITTAKVFDDRVLALVNEPAETIVAKVAALVAEYKIMDKNAKKLVEQAKTLTTYEKNNSAVVKVINLITALNPNSKDYTKKVLAARKAYNALDEVSQKRVTNYANLTAVEDVASLIGLIATLKPTSKTFLKDLQTARTNYDALPEEKKEAIINYEVLVKAETELASAHTVIALIEVALPGEEDYLTKLMNARIAYDKLPSGQKKLVSNIKDLTNREREVKPILSVMVQIENLEPEQSNFVSKVNSARKAYDKLTKDQKKYVNNIATLQNYEPVSTVIELISKLKSSSKTFHEDTTKARALYDALSADLKQYVANYHLLQAAETSILGGGNVVQMINDLSSVDPKQYIKRIEEIRAAYNALPKDQQKAVENYKVLQDQEKIVKPVMSVVAEIEKLMTARDMESQYQKILKAYDKLTATQRRYVYNEQVLLSLDSVIKVYKSIAELKPNDKMYFGMLELVRRDYDSLSSTDKQKVANYSVLLEAEQNMSEVKKVVALIAGLSTTSSTYVQDVANASAAYKALNSKVRGQVLNEDVLKKAEKDVAVVLKVVNAIAILDPDDRSFEKKVLAAQKLYSALTIEQQGLVYNFRVLQEYLDMQ